MAIDDHTEVVDDGNPLSQLFGLCSTGNQDTEFLPERRSLRIHGHSTTIRLERAFWNVLEDLAGQEGSTVAGVVTKIYDHCQFANQKKLGFVLAGRLSQVYQYRLVDL